ncbi:hypothetical protein ACFQZC_03660 [Streptacidiphilus monticola]
MALHAWSASQQTSYFAEPASETDTAERCGELREELALLFAPLLDGYGDVPTTLTVRHGERPACCWKRGRRRPCWCWGGRRSGRAGVRTWGRCPTA